MKSQKKLLRRIRFLIAAGICISLSSLYGEQLHSPEWSYSLDLPEGFTLIERSGSTRYHFSHELFPVDIQMALYPKNQFKQGTQALTWVTGQLGAKTQNAEFKWRNRDAAICRLEFASNAGWALAVELDQDKGWLVMACFTVAARATELEPVLISTLDSVYTDDGSYFESGPMTAFAYPNETIFDATWQNDITRVLVPFNSIDAEAGQSIVDREFTILTAYLDTPLVYAAWKRYYRLIYRDSWARLEKAAFIIGNTLPATSEEITASLLKWTQSFTYERNLKGSDFNSLPDAFVNKKADCDSRSLLLVLLLNQLGIDAVLLVSPEYSHSVAAVDCPGPGARFTVGNKKYLIADTTAKVGPGMIAADMADSSKWFAVTFAAFPQAND